MPCNGQHPSSSQCFILNPNLSRIFGVPQETFRAPRLSIYLGYTRLAPIIGLVKHQDHPLQFLIVVGSGCPTSVAPAHRVHFPQRLRRTPFPECRSRNWPAPHSRMDLSGFGCRAPEKSGWENRRHQIRVGASTTCRYRM